MKKVVISAYYLFRSMRHIVIMSGFGTVSYCKHSPACGEYFLQTVAREGVFSGLYKGLNRVLRCW